jgi:hypothetical protein
MIDEYHLVGNDPVFHFLPLRVQIRVAPTGRVTVEVPQYDPSVSLRLDGVETEQLCRWRVQVVDGQWISF